MPHSDESSSIIEAAAHPDADVDKYFAAFLSKIWVTKGCRFAAHARLSRKNLASQVTVSVLSVYVIAGSLVTLIAPNGALTQNALNAINLILVVTSIFILVLSNIEAGKNHALRAHVMLKCAQQLSELYNEIEFLIKTKQVSNAAIQERIKRYDKIISDFSDNHDDIDYLCLQVAHWRHFGLSGPSAYFKTWRRLLRRFFSTWGYYLLMIVPPPLLLAFVFGKAPAWLQ